MAKRLNYEIGISGNTKELEAALESAMSSLSKLGSLSTGAKITKDLTAAATAARELEGFLNNAVNVNTGKLDLSKFMASLNASKKTL